MYKYKDREFTQSEIDAGIAKLVENVSVNDIDWNEHSDHRKDMADLILGIYYSDLDSSDRFNDISKVIDKYIYLWALFEVTCNPNKYCEVILPDDDL